MHFFEIPYYVGLSAKKYYSFRGQKRLPAGVISIGNLTAGGTGKTPAAIAVAGEALKRGFGPVILTRGYKGSAAGPCFVSKGDAPLLTVEEAGDEPYLMACKLKGVPVIKGTRRYDAGMFAVKELEATDSFPKGKMLFILDDGFQHWGLYRDRDIVLIDSDNPFGNDMLLPFGRLREPVKSVERADIIVITKNIGPCNASACRSDAVVDIIRRHNRHASIFWSSHKPAACKPATGGKEPAGGLSGKRVFGFCGLGAPEAFRRTLLSLGVELAGFAAFRDHYKYRKEDILNIKAAAARAGADWIATTEKDIIKTSGLDLPDNILIIEVEFSIAEDFYSELFKDMR